jgi:hypothetical protein
VLPCCKPGHARRHQPHRLAELNDGDERRLVVERLSGTRQVIGSKLCTSIRYGTARMVVVELAVQPDPRRDAP